MKKLIISATVLATAFFSGCDKQIFDLNYFFKTAYVKWPDGTMKTLHLKAWRGYTGEQLQLEDENGTVYLLNSANVVLTDK